LGCAEKAEQEPEPVAGPEPAPQFPQVVTPAPIPVPEPPAADPSDVLAEVDGVKLTRAEADAEVMNRIRAVSGQVPPHRLEEMRARLGNYVIEQFVMRTLLMNEAERRKIIVSKEDEEKELANIQEQLPEGMTVQEVMEKSPMGMERMLDEVRTKIKMEKLLTAHAGNLDVTDAEIDQFYEQNKERLQVEENVRARHILLSFTEEDDDKSKAEKKARAKELRKQVVEGADFDEVARKNSDCPSSRSGGDLGRFRRGQMVKAFEDVAFALEVDAISEVVETRFGYHVIQVLEHNEAGLLPRAEVTGMLRKEKYDAAMKTLVDELRKKAVIKAWPPAARMPVAPQAPAMP